MTAWLVRSSSRSAAGGFAFAALAALSTGSARADDWAPRPPPSTSSGSVEEEAAKFDAFVQALHAAPSAGQPTVYSLDACLALADRNHPNLWAARARLAFVHGQLEEAKWVPFSQWNMNVGGGVLPPMYGSSYYSSTDLTQRNLGVLAGAGLHPSVRVTLDGLLPLYTFGKITHARRTAEAGVRASEWDLEKFRQQVRMDVRRAYYGLMFARDGRFLIDEISKALDGAFSQLQQKAASGQGGVDEFDLFRVGMYRDQVGVRRAETERGQRYALAALRFLTGVQSGFDIPDQPLRAPETVVAPLVRYLTAARLFRPEVNQARAGVVARQSWVDYQRARFFPDLGIGFNAFYAVTPRAERQTNPWTGDPFNGFGFGVYAGARWPLDFLAQNARLQQAEAQLQETRSLARMALGGIAVEVENQYGVVLEAKSRVERWGHMVRTARKWIATVQGQIELGTRDERALIEPMRYYVDARSQELSALHDMNVQMSQLALMTGWDGAAPKLD